ncbi:hypothetical protein GDO81_022091 [Engystomops pustulosus]|uniref:Uncharacterized protein n=1 Tax=Engystomops pustulosus TaxID=76066 RepID=A0AAV6ZBD1_ENGPU|nr:hypothetical protein GDO81_022091 [Engystomops pustulosus]
MEEEAPEVMVEEALEVTVEGSSGGYGGGSSNSGGGSGGGSSGGNTGGSNTEKCTCNLNCRDEKENGNTAKCKTGYTAVSCSCGMSCGSYSFKGSDTCVCECFQIDWTSARCCKI